MGLANVNDLPVVRGVINMPILGAWTADLVIDSEAPLAGAATLALDGGLTLRGVVSRGGPFLGALYVRLMGGVGGLSKSARVQHYRQTTVRGIVGDLMRTSGETLSPTADVSVLGMQVLAWTQREQPVGAALTSLVGDRRLLGNVAWRVLPDGSIWIGRENWPDAGLTAPDDYQLTESLPSEGWIDLGFEVPKLAPGMSLEGQRVAFVEHTISQETVRTKAWVTTTSG
jgi:hypothetical protein